MQLYTFLLAKSSYKAIFCYHFCDIVQVSTYIVVFIEFYLVIFYGVLILDKYIRQLSNILICFFCKSLCFFCHGIYDYRVKR